MKTSQIESLIRILVVILLVAIIAEGFIFLKIRREFLMTTNKVTLTGTIKNIPDFRHGYENKVIKIFAIISFGEDSNEHNLCEIVIKKQLITKEIAHLKKGDSVYLEGKLDITTYPNRTGVMQNEICIICDVFKIIKNIKEGLKNERRKD